ncbi:hypothetical protein COOONC_19243 [Cooperia oncophora]
MINNMRRSGWVVTDRAVKQTYYLCFITLPSRIVKSQQPLKSKSVYNIVGEMLPRLWCLGPVVMSHINHFVRARTSFSPTIRRPNRRPCNAQAQKLTNNTNSATKKDLGDSVTVLVSQFQLF